MSLLRKHSTLVIYSAFAQCFLSMSPGICAEPSYAAKAATKTEWIFQQRDVEAGQSTVYIAQDAVRVVNLDRGFEVMTSAPDWQVHFIRRAEKTERTVTLKEFRYFSVFGAVDTDWNLYEHLPVRGHEVRAGLTLSEYYTREGIELYLIDKIDVAPEIKYFLQCYYHTPLAGVPYRSVYHFGKQAKTKDNNWLNGSATDFAGQKPWLTTKSVKTVQYHSADFVRPEGFKIVKDQTLMMLSNSRLNSFDSVIKEMTRDGAPGNQRRAH